MPKNRRYGYKSAFIYLFHSIKPHKTWYILASAIALLLIAVNLLQATVTARLVNSSVTGDLKNVYFSLLGFVGILAGSIFLQYIKDISTAKLAANASGDIKRSVCGKLLHAQLGEIIKLHGGDTVSTINTDTAAVCDFIGGDLIRLFSQFTMAAGAFLYLVTMNPRLCFVTFLYPRVGMFFTLSLNKKMNRLYPLCANYRGDALSAAEQALSSVPIIKSFMMERQTEKRVRTRYEDVCRTEMQISVWNALLEPACATTSRIPQILYLLYAGHLVMQGELTIGAFIAMFDLINYVIGPSVHFPFLLNSLNKSIASINRIRRTEALAQEECKPVSETSGAAPAICIEGLSFGYDPQRQLFKNFSFAHRGPGLVALCGESGCGKTTLLDICAGLYAPQEGSVQVFGGIGVVLQDATLFRATVMENIRLGNKGARDADVYNAAKLAGAESFIQALPDGYDTLLGDGTADLSGGQKQRISLARVLLSDAPVWLLDEPTSALDVETERIVLKTIKRMASTKLILVSAHRKALIDCADRAIFLKGGVPDAEVSKL